MRTQFEVWQWSSSSGEYTEFLGQYETLAEAEAIANKHEHCIVVHPAQAWTPFRLNGKPVSAYPVMMYVGGRGHVLFFSIFYGAQHIGFVKADALKTKDIDCSKIIAA